MQCECRKRCGEKVPAKLWNGHCLEDTFLIIKGHQEIDDTIIECLEDKYYIVKGEYR
jgi:hypothetical protein